MQSSTGPCALQIASCTTQNWHKHLPLGSKDENSDYPAKIRNLLCRSGPWLKLETEKDKGVINSQKKITEKEKVELAGPPPHWGCISHFGRCSLSIFFLKGLGENRRRSGQSVTASDFGSNGPRCESGRGRCVESLDKALYSHWPKEKPSH